jgi:hypothetical protein
MKLSFVFMLASTAGVITGLINHVSSGSSDTSMSDKRNPLLIEQNTIKLFPKPLQARNSSNASTVAPIPVDVKKSPLTISLQGVDQRRHSPSETYTSVFANFKVPKFDFNLPPNTPNGSYLQAIWVGIDNGPGLMQCGILNAIGRSDGQDSVDRTAWYEWLPQPLVRIDHRLFDFKPGMLKSRTSQHS